MLQCIVVASLQACVSAMTPMDICCSYRFTVTQHQCTTALVRAICIPQCSVLRCKTGSMQACVTAMTPMEVCCSYRYAVTQHQCTEALVRAICIPHCSVLLCKTGSLQACVTAMTPMKTCCSHRCAVTQHQCTATLVRAINIPHCSVRSAKQAHCYQTDSVSLCTTFTYCHNKSTLSTQHHKLTTVQSAWQCLLVLRWLQHTAPTCCAHFQEL